MSKKRLEEIKKRLALLHSAVDVDDEYKNYIFKDLKVEWLIEQAERVNELEQQNKRYREALNSIITLWIASTDATDDTWLAHEMSETARKALEGENNE